MDCALFTTNAVIFVEGKRTEEGPSREVTWWRGRNQVIRNIECALEWSARKQLSYAFVLLVLEEALCAAGSERARNADDVTGPECISQSLPHLGNGERDALMKHYLGWTTWESMARTFQFDPAVLVDTV